MLLAEIKGFNVLIDNKLCFDQQLKYRQEVQETLNELKRNKDFETGHLLDYLHHQKYYRFIRIDSSAQKNTSIPQKFNSAGKLQKVDGATTYFIAEKQQKIYSKVFSRFISCNKIVE